MPWVYLALTIAWFATGLFYMISTAAVHHSKGVVALRLMLAFWAGAVGFGFLFAGGYATKTQLIVGLLCGIIPLEEVCRS